MKCPLACRIVQLFLYTTLSLAGAAFSICDATHADEIELNQSKAIDLQQVFADSHDGWSLDEVLIRDELRIALMNEYHSLGGTQFEAEVFDQLISLRKRGQLKVPTIKRSQSVDEALQPIAEIAARRMFDEHQCSLDRVFIDPELKSEFDAFAKEVLLDVDLYSVRKAALALRKTRRLRPELLTRVTDWKVTIETMRLDDIASVIAQLPKRPGIYIFRDSSGYQYIGQSKSLEQRLTKHLLGSDRIGLADYLKVDDLNDVTLELHIFAVGSPAESTVVREAYESELIRTRKPKLNLSP